MPSRIRKGRRELTFMEALELHAGPVVDQGRVSMFDSNADRREVWGQHRDELVAESVERSPGTRPWAWWRYDQGVNPEEMDFLMTGEERLRLERMGQMRTPEAERAAVAFRGVDAVGGST